MGSVEDVSYFEKTIMKYKMGYFLSNNFFIHYSKVFVDNEYVVPLIVKPVMAMQYWHVILTVLFNTDINCELKLAFDYLYLNFSYKKGILKRSWSKSPSIKRVHFKENGVLQNKSIVPCYIQQCITQAHIINLNKTLVSLRNPQSKPPLTFKIYHMENDSD